MKALSERLHRSMSFIAVHDPSRHKPIAMDRLGKVGVH
jgi:hypothetical protein